MSLPAHVAIVMDGTGRVNPGLLDQVKVPCSGQDMPLNQVAGIAATGPRQLMVSPWDKANEEAIEKAIREAGMGLNPAIDSGRIRSDMPELSEERRSELVKIVKKEAEAARVAVRNIRRDELGSVKSQAKAGDMSKDEGQRAEQELQKQTDKAIGEIDKLAAAKADELMGV